MRLKLPILVLFSALVFQTQAIDFTVTNLYQDTIEQTIDEELWILTTLADTAGTYNNDLFILSEGTLLLNGTYEGNIWGAGGQDVVVGGHCKRNVRLAGKNLRVDGVINGNTMIAAETVNTGTNAYLGGDVLI
ncbi:MAG TPA: polymer-forming cytoskeletal protein, partial [Pontiella sp.]